MEISHGAVRVAKYKVPNEVIQYVSRDDTQLASWSYSWKCLMTAMRELAKGLTWRVGNGEMVDFWYEKWVGSPLADEDQFTDGLRPPGIKVCNFLGMCIIFYSSSGLCLSNSSSTAL